MKACPTWQLRINLLHHVLGHISGHVSPDVHQNSGRVGGDLVDQDWTGVCQHQLCVIGLKLRTVLRKQAGSHTLCITTPCMFSS